MDRAANSGTWAVISPLLMLGVYSASYPQSVRNTGRRRPFQPDFMRLPTLRPARGRFTHSRRWVYQQFLWA